MTAETDLLPCPFCGTAPQCWGDSRWTYIRCGNDQCIVYSAEPLPYNGDTHWSDAIAAWNRRACVSSATEALRAEVELERTYRLAAQAGRAFAEKGARQAEARAARLAGELRECYEWLFESMSDGPRVSEGALTNNSYTRAFHDLHERLRAALEQEATHG